MCALFADAVHTKYPTIPVSTVRSRVWDKLLNTAKKLNVGMRQIKKEGDDSDKPANGELDGCMKN